MHIGARVASDVFQCKEGECFEKIKQVISIAGDIMIVGNKPGYSEYDQAFTTLLQKAQKCNVKLNYGKLQYKQVEVEIFGETYTTSTCKPAKDKVSVIIAMHSSTNRMQVQSFIGMMNYVSKFFPRLSELAEPIWELSRNKVPFN